MAKLIPNATTKAAMREARRGGLATTSLDGLMRGMGMRKFVGSDGQLAMELHKMNDLVELPDSTPERALWRVDGTLYEWRKGRPYVTVIVSGTPEQQLPITASNKTAAKRAVYDDAKGS